MTKSNFSIGSVLRSGVVWLAIGTTCAGIAAAQGFPEPAQSPSGPPGVVPSKLLPFTGSWRIGLVAGLVKTGVIPLNTQYQAKLDQLHKIALIGGAIPGNEERCIPNGPTMMMKFGFQLFADASRIAVVGESGDTRIIWIDGRTHTPDDQLFNSYYGESIGHWEGDTLVVDTIGLKASDEIEYGLSPTQMHLVERWHMVSPTELAIDATVTDPTVLTKPWHYSSHYRRAELSSQIMYCVAALDRAVDPVTGAQRFDLTPPEGGYIPPGATP